MRLRICSFLLLPIQHYDRKKQQKNTLVNVEVFIGGAPLLELRLVEGLLKFGESHPHWRFSLRGGDERYTEKRLREQQVDGALVLINEHAVAATLDAAGVPWVHLLPGEKPITSRWGSMTEPLGVWALNYFYSKDCGGLLCAVRWACSRS